MTKRAGLVAMGGANALALLASLGGYVAYSRLLTPTEFAIYAAALSIAKLGAALLDGGLKLSLIRRKYDPRDYASAFLASAWLAGIGILVLGATLAILTTRGSLTRDSATFLFAYASAYYVPYPWLVGPLARLEKQGKFARVAKAEASGTAIEYALPALLWVTVAPGFWAFGLSAWAGRLLRLLWIHCGEKGYSAARTTTSHTLVLLKEGLRFQGAALVSAVRDNLHFIIVAPWFGQAQAGVYAWLLQLCAAASQVFVQTASRVALPWLLQAKTEQEQWASTVFQIRLLSIMCLPVLVLLLPIAPAVNQALFHGRWVNAMPLLPLLLLRMAPGLATTPLGALLFARHGAGAYLRANAWWTGGECVAALMACAVLGRSGLAWSYGVMAWLGVGLLLPSTVSWMRWNDILRSILWRPSLAMSLGAVILLYLTNVQLNGVLEVAVFFFIVYPMSVFAEPSMRQEARRVLGRLRMRPNT